MEVGNKEAACSVQFPFERNMPLSKNRSELTQVDFLYSDERKSMSLSSPRA